MSHLKLLEEMNDAGFPFNLEPNILEELVSIPSFMSQTTDMVNLIIFCYLCFQVMGPGGGISNLLPNGSLTQIPWRRQNVSKTTNEIYIDFIEEIDAIVERFANCLEIILISPVPGLPCTQRSPVR
jgi:AP-3 complex subunit mu